MNSIRDNIEVIGAVDGECRFVYRTALYSLPAEVGLHVRAFLDRRLNYSSGVSGAVNRVLYGEPDRSLPILDKFVRQVEGTCS
jgi:hypothetical protein